MSSATGDGLATYEAVVLDVLEEERKEKDKMAGSLKNAVNT